MGGDVIAVVTEFDQRRASAFVFRIGKTWNEHAPGQCICTMRSDGATCSFLEVVDRLYVSRLRRISVDVEDEHAAGIETGEPELTSVICEAAMVRLVAPFNGNAVDHFAVGG